MSKIYTVKRDAILAVPNELHDAINAKLDAAFLVTPEAEKDRAHLYNTLLGYFDEHGTLPDFQLAHRPDGPSPEEIV